MVTPVVYRPVPRTVEAVFWNGRADTAEEVVLWADENGHIDLVFAPFEGELEDIAMAWITLPSGDHLRLDPHSWVVKDQEGRFKVWSNSEFLRNHVVNVEAPDGQTFVGFAWMICPECEATVPSPVFIENVIGEDRRPVYHSDYTELTAHMWSHNSNATQDKEWGEDES